MVRLLGLSPGNLASQKIWQPGLEGQGYTLRFLPLSSSPGCRALLLQHISVACGIASHSSYESVFTLVLRREQGSAGGIQ